VKRKINLDYFYLKLFIVFTSYLIDFYTLSFKNIISSNQIQLSDRPETFDGMMMMMNDLEIEMR
jgi:hypothetical protein